ncbi:hypothetical protein ACP6PL_14175 [Dapis sp. BLCC M126]|uniref:hypothetical protein n=1 Tax=Dapis sp. BLCC M126 TaxID=3400189 RepID=UPI003CEC6B26
MITKFTKNHILIEQLQAKIRNYYNPVDYLGIRLKQNESTAISFRGQQLNVVNRHFSVGGGIRTCYKGS